MNSLPALESKIAVDGLTHAYMLDFFRLFNTSASDAVLPTFEVWVAQLRTAGVAIEEIWYERMVSDWTNHGRLTHETLLQAPEIPVINIGEDNDAN